MKKKDNYSLTSVKILTESYNKFKMKCIGTEMNLQELVNTSIRLYNIDDNFIKIIASGSLI